MRCCKSAAPTSTYIDSNVRDGFEFATDAPESLTERRFYELRNKVERNMIYIRVQLGAGQGFIAEATKLDSTILGGKEVNNR